MGNIERERDKASPRISVCAADRAIRERIESTLILAGHEVVTSTASVRELVADSPSTAPHLVVLGWVLEPFSPLREVTAVRAELCDIPLVVVAVGFFTRTARRLLSADVDGLLHATDIEDALAATVRAVFADQLCVPSSMRGVLARPVFSHREKQVLELVVAGLSNGEIAARLFLSESTVKSHLAASFRKLGVSSRSEAARRAMDPDLGLELPAGGSPPQGSGTRFALG
jgi:DNA-binding NarL/FixJ family response regulator